MARILVVEDDPDTRALVIRRLQHAGHRVQGANDAADAITLVAEKGPPDAVVLDVNMPDVDGFELLGRLRDQTGRVDLPAVFLSGRSELADIAMGRSLGATYLTKPFIGTTLLGAIDTQLDVDGARARVVIRILRAGHRHPRFDPRSGRPSLPDPPHNLPGGI